MWPFRKKDPKKDPAALRPLFDATHEYVDASVAELRHEVERLEWRLDQFIRYFEDVSGVECDASWGAPTRTTVGVATGSPDEQLRKVAEFTVPPPPA